MSQHNISLTDQVGQPTCPNCGGTEFAKTTQLSADGMIRLATCMSCEAQFDAKMLKKPGVKGEVTIQLIHDGPDEVRELLPNDHPRVAHQVYDDNVFTDVGRNWLAALISYATFTQAPGANEPASSKRRYDGVRYMMVGTGTQLETNSVVALDNPVAYNSVGDYLAQVVAPNELPGSGISAVFQRIYGVNEISMPTTVYVSEFGLFPSGIESSPLSVSVSNHPPLAYKTVEPFPKNTQFLLGVRWEIKF